MLVASCGIDLLLGLTTWRSGRAGPEKRDLQDLFPGHVVLAQDLARST
jgi:hypothetical protein